MAQDDDVLNDKLTDESETDIRRDLGDSSLDDTDVMDDTDRDMAA